MAYNNILVL